jgi:hypothetical protein
MMADNLPASTAALDAATARDLPDIDRNAVSATPQIVTTASLHPKRQRQ